LTYNLQFKLFDTVTVGTGAQQFAGVHDSRCLQTSAARLTDSRPPTARRSDYILGESA
jgi:hypothetical protein